MDVADDGRGLPAAPVAGVGLPSMRERAEELGGRCTVDSDGERHAGPRRPAPRRGREAGS